MSRLKFFIILIVVLIIFSLSIYAKITLDETKIYIKVQPINYITNGEDCTYDSWIDRYEQKRQNCKINTPSVKTKAIIGNIKEDHIEYNPQRDVKNISINLEIINKVRNQGDIIGMFVEKGKLYVAIEEKKLSKYIREKTGYLEELKVGNIFSEAGWDVRHSNYYLDRDDEKGRRNISYIARSSGEIRLFLRNYLWLG